MSGEIRERDLLTSLLQTVLRKVLHTSIVQKFSGDIDDEAAEGTVDSLVKGCLDEYNVKLLMTYGLKEIRRDNATVEFPPLILDHYNVREAVIATWRYTQLGKRETFPIPEISIQSSTVQICMEELTQLARVQPLMNFSWKTAAAFQLDVREVVEKCVKWSVRNLPLLRTTGSEGDNYVQNWKVEICLSHSKSSKELDANSSHVDSKVLLAKMLANLLLALGYSVIGGGKSFTVIPSTKNFSNVLVAFLNSETRERVFVEKDPVDFYTKYSGGVVILYNYARLKSILDKYDGLIESDEYPPLPSLENVDFSNLGQSKEEVSVIFMLFLWPRALCSIVNLSRNAADKVNTSFFFDFVKNFAKLFDAYYNHVMVIVPKSTSHNFGTMIARIWLLKAVGKVFEQFMDLAAMEVGRL